MSQSTSIAELAKALSAAQGEFQPAKMNAVNPFLKNKYADLGSIIESIRPVLAKHGLAVVQSPAYVNGEIGVDTLLMHTSGEWLSSIMWLPLSDDKGRSLAQSAGSIISYLRRYSLSAMLCLYADEDTDGNAGKPAKTEQPVTPSASHAAHSGIEYPEHLSVVKDRNGVRYVDIGSDRLPFMANSIKKASEKPGVTEDEKAEYAMKFDTINQILELRGVK